MSTPAWITRTLSDGSLEMRHCRSSGGPEGVGMGLAKFANTPALVDWLFGLNRSFDSILSAAWPGDNKASKETGEGGYIPWPAQSPAHQETPVPVLLAYGADDSCVELKTAP